IFANFEYETAEGHSRSNNQFIYGIALPPPFNPSGTAGITSDWSDYHRYGGEAGSRFLFFSNESRFRPFIALSGGVSEVSAINIKSTADFGGGFVIQVYDGPFFGDSTIGTGTG